MLNRINITEISCKRWLAVCLCSRGNGDSLTYLTNHSTAPNEIKTQHDSVKNTGTETEWLWGTITAGLPSPCLGQTHACTHTHWHKLQCTLQQQAKLVTVHFITAGVKTTVLTKGGEAWRIIKWQLFSWLEILNHTVSNLIQMSA